MLGLKVLVAMIAGLAVGLFAWSLRQAYLRAGRTEAAVYLIAATVCLLPVSKVQYIMLEHPMLVLVSAIGAYFATHEFALKAGWHDR